MPRNTLILVVLLLLGFAFLTLGFDASHALTSDVSRAAERAPSNRSLALMMLGLIVAAIGLVGLFRRAR